MLKKLSFIFLISLSLFAAGCEKEIGDVIVPENFNPNEGNYNFTITSQLSGSKSIYINNRGNFSFFITLNSGGSDIYTVIITGNVNSDGILDGNVFKGQSEIGYVRGFLGGGDFYFNDSGYVVQGIYGTNPL